jgi:PAS domain S-box-containing protein
MAGCAFRRACLNLIFSSKFRTTLLYNNRLPATYGQFAIICHNISEQKKTENALRESEQKFRILEENPIVGIFVSQDKKLIYVNDRMAEMHGYSKEEILGQPFDILIHPDDRNTIKSKMDTYLEMGERYRQRFEILRIKKNGESFWGGAIVTRGKYNGKDAILGSVIDISESKLAEEELRKSEERYKEIVEETDDLIIKVDNTGVLLLQIIWQTRYSGCLTVI